VREPLGLCPEHLRVAAAPRHQLLVGTGLGDAPAVEQDDPVGLAHRGEAVRDEHDAGLPRPAEQPGEQLQLAAYVQVRGGLVEHEQPGAGAQRVERTGQGHLLPLAAGQVDAAGAVAGQRRIPPVRQLVQHGPQPGLAGGLVHRGPVPGCGGVPQRDVVGHREVVPHEVLEHHGDPFPPGGLAELADVGTGHGDRAGVRPVQAGEQLDQGGLAGAVEPDDREQLTRFDGEVQAVEYQPVRPRVAEPDAAQFDPRRCGRFIAGSPRRRWPRGGAAQRRAQQRQRPQPRQRALHLQRVVGAAGRHVHRQARGEHRGRDRQGSVPVRHARGHDRVDHPERHHHQAVPDPVADPLATPHRPQRIEHGAYREQLPADHPVAETVDALLLALGGRHHRLLPDARPPRLALAGRPEPGEPQETPARHRPPDERRYHQDRDEPPAVRRQYGAGAQGARPPCHQPELGRGAVAGRLLGPVLRVGTGHPDQVLDPRVLQLDDARARRGQARHLGTVRAVDAGPDQVPHRHGERVGQVAEQQHRDEARQRRPGGCPAHDPADQQGHHHGRARRQQRPAHQQHGQRGHRPGAGRAQRPQQQQAVSQRLHPASPRRPRRADR
jgi:hypothetical protein